MQAGVQGTLFFYSLEHSNLALSGYGLMQNKIQMVCEKRKLEILSSKLEKTKKSIVFQCFIFNFVFSGFFEFRVLSFEFVFN